MDSRDRKMWLKKIEQDDFDKLKNIYLNTQYSLWNSLITFNAIILSVISILRILDANISKILVSWLLTTCSISIFLIITNYYISKFIYYFLSKNANPDKGKNADNTTKNYCVNEKLINIIQIFIEVVVILSVIVNLFKIGIWVINFV